MNLLETAYIFNKYRRHIGLKNAIACYKGLHANKTGIFKLNMFKYPLKLRIGNPADISTFNEVVLRNEYSLSLPSQTQRIIDCGANIGLSSVVFKNLFPESTIVAVEPEENNFNVLQFNTDNYKNIILKKAGIWSKTTHLKITNSESLSNAFTVSEVNEKEAGTIDSITISDIMAEQGWNTIDLLKIDIEGAEKEIFTNNYDYWIPRTKIIIVETHDRFVKGSSKAVFSAINKYNFSCKPKGHNFIFTNEDK